MRFFLVLSWRHAWQTEGMEARAFSDEKEARSMASTLNAVLVAVSYEEGDLKPRVDAFDYEFRDDEGRPQPARWIDSAPRYIGRLQYEPAPSPVVRVGKDIEREK